MGGSVVKTYHRVLAASGTSVSCGADTTEDTLATIIIPANMMGTNGILRVTASWSFTASTNSKTWRVRFGSMAAQDNGTTSAGISSLRSVTEIRNADSVSAQKANSFTFSSSGSLPVTAPTTAAIDTTAAVTMLITGQKGTAGETLTLDSYIVELLTP